MRHSGAWQFAELLSIDFLNKEVFTMKHDFIKQYFHYLSELKTTKEQRTAK